MNWTHTLHRALNGFFILTLAIISLGMAGPAQAQPASYSYANGIVIPAATMLPVFHIKNLVVTSDTTFNLTQTFSGIYDRSQPSQDKFQNHDRFVSLNQANNTVLEQFGATGGFYAYNHTRAFGNLLPAANATLDTAQAQLNACRFLSGHPQLLAASTDLTVPGLNVMCDNNFTTNPLYQVSTEFLSGEGAVTALAAVPAATAAAATTTVPLRVMVTVPLNFNTGQYSQVPFIPLGGPGGHISFLFDDTTAQPTMPGPTLDGSVVGLQALAMPAYGRSFQFNKLVPAVNPGLVQESLIQMITLAYPGAKNINVPPPALEYYLGAPGQPQDGLEPDLSFSGITFQFNGQDITLKDLTLPAAEGGAGGLGPTVSILSLGDGSVYLPHMPVSLVGEISAGTAPYSFDWQLDDGTSLGGGALPAAGKTPEVKTTLPAPDPKGGAGTLPLHLVVTDADGVTREAVISLNAPLPMFLPVSLKQGLGLAALSAPKLSPASPVLSAANYSFGVEYGSDYPPYGPGGPDLGGVPPDANGLSSSLFGLGWPRVFNWYNASAWERDWRDCGAKGGSDCTYGVDRADYVYYSGHGNNGGIAVPSNTHDTNWADGSNAGFQRARWVGFSSCLTLRAQWPTPGAEPIRRWFGAFQGAHMLLGFNSVMGDIPFGPYLVDNMRMPSFFGIDFPWMQSTIAEAWVQTAFEMNAGKPAYIYATSASVDPSGNKLPKPGDALMPRPVPVNWFFWVWWNE